MLSQILPIEKLHICSKLPIGNQFWARILVLKKMNHQHSARKFDSRLREEVALTALRVVVL